MVTSEDISPQKSKVAIVGLGHYRLRQGRRCPRFRRQRKENQELKDGFDATGELTGEQLTATRIDYTLDAMTYLGYQEGNFTAPKRQATNCSPYPSIPT